MPEKNLDALRKQKETSGVHDDIARIKAEQLGKAKAEGLGSVELEGDTYHKLPSGGWRGPGGNYGPTTEFGQKLGQAEGQALQRHHDYYAKLAHEGGLADEDRLQFNLARQREAGGQVKTWTPEPPKAK